VANSAAGVCRAISGKTTRHERVNDIKDIIAATDRLVATLRAEQELRLAAVLHHQLHQAAWNSHSELLAELKRLLRKAQASEVSSYSSGTGAEIEKILAAIEIV
jgi:hypothetical protein